MVNGKYGGEKCFAGISDCDRRCGWGRVEGMSFPRMVLRIIVIGIVLGLAGRVTAALPERKTFQFGEFTIEASAGDEAYVEALAVQLADYKLPAGKSPAPARLALDDLSNRRELFLAKIIAHLGLVRPTERMNASYDGTLKLWGEMGRVMLFDLPRHYAIWRKPELMARIDAGEIIPGFSRDGNGGMRFLFQWDIETGHGMTPEQKQTAIDAEWRKFVYPIKIALKPEQSPELDVAGNLDDFRKFREVMAEITSQQMQRTHVFTVLHEATESGIVWHYIASKDRRWFCDGIANYVAWKVIEAELGPEEARGYYDLSAELKKFANEAASIDLAAWPAAENLKQANYAENLNTANYAFATKVIADVCAKHGDSILPKLFTEIGKTPYEKATMDTVYRAFKKLTREDLRSYLPKPVAKR